MVALEMGVLAMVVLSFVQMSENRILLCLGDNHAYNVEENAAKLTIIAGNETKNQREEENG